MKLSRNALKTVERIGTVGLLYGDDVENCDKQFKKLLTTIIGMYMIGIINQDEYLYLYNLCYETMNKL